MKERLYISHLTYDEISRKLLEFIEKEEADILINHLKNILLYSNYNTSVGSINKNGAKIWLNYLYSGAFYPVNSIEIKHSSIGCQITLKSKLNSFGRVFTYIFWFGFLIFLTLNYDEVFDSLFSAGYTFFFFLCLNFIIMACYFYSKARMLELIIKELKLKTAR
jgi:hypothetical protein